MPVTLPEAVDHHNAVVTAAMKRMEELEGRMAAVLEPILRQAGMDAASRFEALATDHLTAAAPRTAVSRVLSDSQPLTAAGPGVTSLSTMVAVKPRESEAARIAQEDGLDPATLHVTLAYLGEIEGDLTEIAGVLSLVAARHAPLAGSVGGAASFGGGENGAPVVLLPSVPGLVELRVDVTEALTNAGVNYSRDYGYIPHLTVDYQQDPNPDRDPIGEPLHFDELYLVRGDVEVWPLPLIGSKPLTAAADPPKWSAPAADELVNVDHVVSQLRTKTDPVRRAVIESTMRSTLDKHGIDFDVHNRATAKVLAHSGEQITAIAKTTQLNVNRIISRSYEEGLSIPDTAKAIRAGMAEASVTRSTLIARTEMVGAVNGGSLAATSIVSDATGMSFQKEWLTAPGAMFPRHELYEGLNGQQAPLEGFFDVNGEELQYPGDPAGSPEEVCNCRCAVAYVESGSGEVVDEGDADSSGPVSAEDLASQVMDGGDEVAAIDEVAEAQDVAVSESPTFIEPVTPLPPPTDERLSKVLNPVVDRPYSHWSTPTLNRQIVKSRSIVRNALAKDPTLSSLSTRERALHDTHKDKLQVLLNERAIRKGEPLPAPEVIAPKAAAPSATLVQEQTFRPGLTDMQKERVTRMRQVYSERPKNEDVESLFRVRSNPTAWEMRLQSTGADFASEVESRITGSSLQERREAIREVLSDIREIGRDPSLKAAPEWRDGDALNTKWARDLVENKAMPFFPRDWLNAVESGPDITYEKVARGYFREALSSTDKHTIGLSYERASKVTTDPASFRVAIHELGHLMESTYLDIVRAERAFYNRRTKGETLKPYKGRRSELTREDEFVNGYIGRDYGGDFYEVLSVGMESLMTGSNDLWYGDPDMRNFILGLLVGV